MIDNYDFHFNDYLMYTHMHNIIPTRVWHLFIYLCRHVKNDKENKTFLIIFFYFLSDSILYLDKCCCYLVSIAEDYVKTKLARAHARSFYRFSRSPRYGASNERCDLTHHTTGQVRLDKSTDCDRGGAARRTRGRVIEKRRDVSMCRRLSLSSNADPIKQKSEKKKRRKSAEKRKT